MNTQLFCANCQTETEHTFTALNNELIGTCACGRFVKFDATMSREQLAQAFADHKAHNVGQEPARDTNTPHPILDVLASL